MPRAPPVMTTFRSPQSVRTIALLIGSGFAARCEIQHRRSPARGPPYGYGKKYVDRKHGGLHGRAIALSRPQGDRGEGRSVNHQAAHVTSFVGRRADRKQVRALLSEARLVTLVGVGGVGKT